MRRAYHTLIDLFMLTLLVVTLVLLFLGRTTTHEAITLFIMLGLASLMTDQGRSKP